MGAVEKFYVFYSISELNLCDYTIRQICMCRKMFAIFAIVYMLYKVYMYVCTTVEVHDFTFP